jgi:glycerol-3-phosphate cytidylyltransferase
LLVDGRESERVMWTGERSMKKVVLTYGTFDVFHVGHLSLLKRLRAMGDRLIVGVTTDEFNQLRGKETLVCYADRLQIVSNLKCVDAVIALERAEQKVDDIRRYSVSIFGMGDDWQGRFDNLRAHCEVVYLPRTENVSSSQIRQSLAALDGASVGGQKTAAQRLSPVRWNPD